MGVNPCVNEGVAAGACECGHAHSSSGLRLEVETITRPWAKRLDAGVDEGVHGGVCMCVFVCECVNWNVNAGMRIARLAINSKWRPSPGRGQIDRMRLWMRVWMRVWMQMCV